MSKTIRKTCIHLLIPLPKLPANDHLTSGTKLWVKSFVDPETICKLPVDSGPCLDGEFTRWAFNEQQQTCVAFTFHGCAGNLNRFKSFKACLDYCLPGHSAQPGETPNVIDVDSSVEKERCADVQSVCTSLTQCPYGVERWVDAEGCENCRCYDPCVSQAPQCPANSTCAISLVTNPTTNQTEYKAVCRQSKCSITTCYYTVSTNSFHNVHFAFCL
ncbi:hypothetical protein J6590_054752 [Homalodisca vitripennis]|nr:hypothetical protein J6590_054752 [Homalodisca vitripennis]